MAKKVIGTQPDLIPADSTAKMSEHDKPCYFLSLTVKNVRSFSVDQTLDLCQPNERPARWTVLLGDNGVGKTTLLQAIAAMAPRLMPGLTETAQPSKDIQRRPLVPDLFLRKSILEESSPFRRVGAAELEIECKLSVGNLLTEDAEHHAVYGRLKQGKDAGEAVTYPAEIEGFKVYGYGALRRIGRAALSEKRDDDPSATLFDENKPLLNAEEWLLQADYSATKSDSPIAESRRDRIKDVLLRILPDIDAIRIEPNVEKTPVVEVHTFSGWVPLRSLSSGYRAVVAWMVDFANKLFDRYPNSPDPLGEPAVVVVDQIDIFLHPKWQRALLQNLTNLFPNTQFIVTAHSPLIVQAAVNANLAVVRRDGDHVVIDNRPETVRGWRLDQLITSDLFDNLAARDSETQGLINRRRSILAKPTLTADDKALLHDLDQRIGPLPIGDTAEEIRAVEIIERAARKLTAAGSQ
jgi:energy-coupling factor transporter ATP-binding protein EcfA2